ncbi:uncharacterized protein LOC135401736 [Ornithodoros turicata]|uniref:uncharacterized protein LOC135401736 n=1 Tax=Ornithodoros turicata TaxID=34597 RepID=UPI00313912F4
MNIKFWPAWMNAAVFLCSLHAVLLASVRDGGKGISSKAAQVERGEKKLATEKDIVMKYLGMDALSAPKRVLRSITINGPSTSLVQHRALVNNDTAIYLRVQNYNEHLDRAKSSRREDFCTALFEVAGYTTKLCLALESTGNRVWLAPTFQICPGPQDSGLQWPFSLSYTFIFVHPQVTTYDMKIGSQITNFEQRNQQKPKGQCNKPIGHMKLGQGIAGQFVRNDTIAIGLVFHPNV